MDAATRDPHRGPTQGTHTEGTRTGDPHRGPAQGTHTGDPHRGEGPREDPPPEGRATQGTHTEHTQTRGASAFPTSLRPSSLRRAAKRPPRAASIWTLSKIDVLSTRYCLLVVSIPSGILRDTLRYTKVTLRSHFTTASSFFSHTLPEPILSNVSCLVSRFTSSYVLGESHCQIEFREPQRQST